MSKQTQENRQNIALSVIDLLINRFRTCLNSSPNFKALDLNKSKQEIIFILKKMEQQNQNLIKAHPNDISQIHLTIQGMNFNLVYIVKNNLMNAKAIKHFLTTEYQNLKQQGQNHHNDKFQKSQNVKEHVQNFMKQLHYINRVTIKIFLLTTFRKENLPFDKFSEDDINFLLQSTEDDLNQKSLNQKIDQQQTLDVRFQCFIKMLQEQLPKLTILNQQIKSTSKLQFFGLFMFKRILAQKDNLEQVQHIKKVWNNFVQGWLVINFTQLYEENQKSSLFQEMN